MARYRGFKGTLLQWCYRNRKADCLLMGLLQAVNELNQMKLLKPGDPCPCCGRPIKSEDPEVLALLTLIRDSMADSAREVGMEAHP